MGRAPTQTVRLWRLRPWSKNDLMRAGDRVEAVAVLVVVAFVLIMVPVAWAVGSAVDTRLDERTRADLSTRQEISAVLIEDPKIGTWGSSEVAPVEGWAKVQWVTDGEQRSGSTRTEPGAKAGETTTVWIDASGNLTEAPTTTAENTLTAVGVGVALWNSCVALGLLVVVGARWRARRFERNRNQHAGTHAAMGCHVLECPRSVGQAVASDAHGQVVLSREREELACIGSGIRCD